MIRLGTALCLITTLSGCEELDVEDDACWTYWDLETRTLAPEPGTTGLSVRTRDLSEQPYMEGFQSLSVSVTVSNLDPSDDCVVAVYRRHRQVSADALPMLSPSVAPPASGAGLGTLVGAVNLAADRLGDPDRVDVEVSLPAPAEGRSTWLTVATCEAAMVEVALEVEGNYCGEWEDDPSFSRAFARVF